MNPIVDKSRRSAVVIGLRCLKSIFRSHDAEDLPKLVRIFHCFSDVTGTFVNAERYKLDEDVLSGDPLDIGIVINLLDGYRSRGRGLVDSW